MEEEEEEEVSLLSHLVNIEIGRREKRPICDRCSRPEGVCWCRGLGGRRLNVRSRVVVLQHPHEEKRCLRTAPILRASLPQDRYLELRGKRFSLARHPELSAILSSGCTILMYPGDGAVGLEQLPVVGEAAGEGEAGEQGQPPYNIVILDGTWQQAKSIYYNCPSLHALPQVCLSGKYTSEYIIRTQPTDDALSTVETAALALATLEQDWSIYDTLVQPLKLLCQYQLSHGAVPHHSKEHMLVSGRCSRPLGKRTYKKLRKCGARHPHTLAALLLGGGDESGQDEDRNDDDRGEGGCGSDGGGEGFREEKDGSRDGNTGSREKCEGCAEGSEEFREEKEEEVREIMEEIVEVETEQGEEEDGRGKEETGRGGRIEIKNEEEGDSATGEKENEGRERKNNTDDKGEIKHNSDDDSDGEVQQHGRKSILTGGGERVRMQMGLKDECISKVKRNISSHVPWEFR